MVFNLIFAIPFGYLGLAIATSMSATMNAGLLYSKLHRLGVYQVSPSTLFFLAKVSVSSLIMAAGLLYYRPAIANWLAWAPSMQMTQLAIMIAGAGGVFLVSALLLGIRPRQLLSKAI